MNIDLSKVLNNFDAVILGYHLNGVIISHSNCDTFYATYVPPLSLSLYVAPFVPPFWHQSQINSSRVEVFLSRPSLISLSLPLPFCVLS